MNALINKWNISSHKHIFIKDIKSTGDCSQKIYEESRVQTNIFCDPNSETYTYKQD